jgi:hypothetical protein
MGFSDITKVKPGTLSAILSAVFLFVGLLLEILVRSSAFGVSSEKTLKPQRYLPGNSF